MPPPPRNFSKGERFFISGRGTNKKDSGRGTIFESQVMGRKGVKKILLSVVVFGKKSF